MNKRVGPSGQKKLRRIFIIRHGAYDGLDGPINESGREQIALLSDQIKPVLAGLRVRLVSSGVIRARTSAEELAMRLNLEEAIERSCALEPDFLGKADLEKALDYLFSCSGYYDAVIAVTHLQYVEDLSRKIQETWHGHEEGQKLPHAIDWAFLNLDSVECELGRY